MGARALERTSMLPPGQPRKYSGVAGGRPSAVASVPPGDRRWKAMRELLEFLGLVEPPRGRREPVALPAWSRWALPFVLVALTAASALALVLVRLLLP